MGAVTPEWLTAALREVGIERASVQSFEASPVGEEYGFTARLFRLTLQYDQAEEGVPASLVAKFPNPSARLAQDPARRRRLHERCAREVLFYQQLGEEAGIRLPHMYFAAVEEDGARFVLLLEDLTAGQVAGALERLPPGRIAQVLEAAADMHAKWWQHPRLPALQWLPPWGAGGERAQRRLQESRGPFLDQFGRWVPEPVKRMIDSLTACYASVLKQLGSSPWTLVHADLHGDNILFDVPGSPVAVVDWQGVSRAKAAVDLMHTAADWPDTDDRLALLHGYHDVLLARGVTGYGFDDLLDDCRLVLLQHLGGVVNGYANFDADAAVPRERELVLRFFEEGRLFRALLDHDVGRLLAELAR